MGSFSFSGAVAEAVLAESLDIIVIGLIENIGQGAVLKPGALNPEAQSKSF